MAHPKVTEPERVALVVEDEKLLADVVAWALEDIGYSVLVAGDGEAALNVLAGAGRLDLLVTDIRMPGCLEGWTLAERVRAQRPDVPVVYVSGFYNAEPRRVPNSVFVQKPFRPEQLVSAISQVC